MITNTHVEADPEFTEATRTITSKHGWSLDSLSQEAPTLAVFLRHLGCVYCRESLTELERLRPSIEAEGVRLTFIHMGTDAQAAGLLKAFGLEDIERFSDPQRKLYEAFGLERTSLGRMLAPRTLVDMLRTSLRPEIGLRRSVGRIVGDSLQMPGVFLVHRGRIVGDFRPETLEARPDYLELAALEC